MQHRSLELQLKVKGIDGLLQPLLSGVVGGESTLFSIYKQSEQWLAPAPASFDKSLLSEHDVDESCSLHTDVEDRRLSRIRAARHVYQISPLSATDLLSLTRTRPRYIKYRDSAWSRNHSMSRWDACSASVRGQAF
jgi:hypothetical protein